MEEGALSQKIGAHFESALEKNSTLDGFKRPRIFYDHTISRGIEDSTKERDG